MLAVPAAARRRAGRDAGLKPGKDSTLSVRGGQLQSERGGRGKAARDAEGAQVESVAWDRVHWQRQEVGKGGRAECTQEDGHPLCPSHTGQLTEEYICAVNALIRRHSALQPAVHFSVFAAPTSRQEALPCLLAPPVESRPGPDVANSRHHPCGDRKSVV